MLGDNRPNSIDSRQMGLVQRDRLIACRSGNTLVGRSGCLLANEHWRMFLEQHALGPHRQAAEITGDHVSSEFPMSQECKAAPADVGQQNRDIPLVIALLLELRPISVSYRRYRECVSGKTLLEYCAEKLGRLQFGSPTPCVIAVHGEAERDLVTAITENLPLKTIALRAADLLQAAEEIGSIAGAANVMLLSLEHILAPHDLAAKAADCHLTRQSGITFVSGLPEKVTPVVIQCNFAVQLRSAGLPLNSLDLHQLPHALDQLRESSQDPLLAPVARIRAEELYPKLDMVLIPAAVDLEFPRKLLGPMPRSGMRRTRMASPCCAPILPSKPGRVEQPPRSVF